VNITVTVPDDMAQEVQAAYAAMFGYETEVDGQPNPTNLDDFVVQCIQSQIAGTYSQYRMNQAQTQAAADAAKLSNGG
jgi:hypothetical protein